MKNLFKCIFIGALIGVAILMLSYVGVYHIEGQEVFENEILQLTQIGVLQNQLIFVALYGALFVVTMSTSAKLIRNEDKTVYKPIVGGVIFIIIEIIFVLSLDYVGQQFSENIGSMIVVSHVLALCIYILSKCVMLFLEEFLINKKIKEKNAQEPEKGNE